MANVLSDWHPGSWANQQQLGNTRGTWNQHMGVEPKIGGKPPKWMVKIMESPTELMILGYPYFWKHQYFAEGMFDFFPFGGIYDRSLEGSSFSYIFSMVWCQIVPF